ncbi:hypothetical protein LINPERPRIM_LOCUS34585 [Linum perenne]
MAPKNIMLMTIVAIVVAAMSADISSADTWPPTCNGYTKSTRACVPYVSGLSPTIPNDCCIGLESVMTPAKKSLEKGRAACYCVVDSMANPKYKLDLLRNVAKTCGGYDLPTKTKEECRHISGL